jgi:hypothetical protein
MTDLRSGKFGWAVPSASGESEGRDQRIAEALDRARVVGVLDAWTMVRPALARRYETMSDVCVLWDSVSGRHIYTGGTPDAARAAAAKAIENGDV